MINARKNRNSKRPEKDENGSKTQKDTHRVSLFCSFNRIRVQILLLKRSKSTLFWTPYNVLYFEILNGRHCNINRLRRGVTSEPHRLH